MLLTFAWTGWLVGVVTVLFLLICVMMILTVLIQRPQGGGLSGAFGSGAGSGQTAFGAKTGDALTIFTIIVFVLFLGLAVSLNYGYRPSIAAPPGDVIEAGTGSAPAGTPATSGGIEGGAPAAPAPEPQAQPDALPPAQPAPPQQEPSIPAPVPPAPAPSDQPK